MTPQSYCEVLQEVINSLDNQKMYSGKEVKNIFQKIKDNLIASIETLDVYFKIETALGTEETYELLGDKTTHVTLQNLKDSYVLRVPNDVEINDNEVRQIASVMNAHVIVLPKELDIGIIKLHDPCAIKEEVEYFSF